MPIAMDADFHAGQHGLTATHGIAAGTPVMTLDGALPVEFLMPGDRVLTRAGMRILRAVDVAVLHDAPMVRIGADTMAVDTPDADLMVIPDQPVLVRDWRARAFGSGAQAMVAAAQLVDGEFIRAETVAELRLFTLCFDAPVVIYAGGLELGCPAVAVPA